MAALTTARTTKQREARTFARKVAGTKKIFEGALVCLNATGYATPGAVATTLTADGIALSTVDNSAGADGDLIVETKKGTFQFFNSAAGDAITIADIGKTAYVVDDQTVAKTNGTNTRSAAGVIQDVDAQGVWVKIA
jgi:hypothetical protein